MRILLVDDDADIRAGFTAALTKRGHTVRTAGSVHAALAAAQAEPPDVAVVDLMLPDGDGFSLCREIRERFRFPTIMLTARDDEVDVVGGLEAGADDYVVKPVSPAVLDARLRAVVRRSTEAVTRARVGGVLHVGALSIDESAGELLANGRLVPLTVTELRLLAELAINHGQVLSRSHLIDRVWQDQEPNTPRVVDTAVQRLRAKLAEAGVEEPRLETLRGFGYRLS